MASGIFPTTAASLQLVSMRNPSFAPSASGGGDSGLPIITGEGRYVLFASTADNLVLTSSHGPIPAFFLARLNVFLRDRTNGATFLVSVNSDGTGGGNENSIPAAISSNGRYALFESAASNLVTGELSGQIQRAGWLRPADECDLLRARRDESSLYQSSHRNERHAVWLAQCQDSARHCRQCC